MTPSIEKAQMLSLEAGMCQSVEELRALLSSNADTLTEAVEEALALTIRRMRPDELIALLDTSKGLIFRNMIARRRTEQMGLTGPKVFITMSRPHLVEQYLRTTGSTGLCYFYKSQTGEVSALLAQNFGADRPIGFAQLHIIPREEARDFEENIQAYAKSLKASKPDFKLQGELLKPFGKLLIPFFLAHGSAPHTLIFIPHGVLHILPLHAMSLGEGREQVYIDQVVRSLSYASCLPELLFSGQFSQESNDKVNRGGRILAVLDTACSELSWLQTELLQFETMKKLGAPVDIVTSGKRVPTDFHQYSLINWSGHAKSDPSSWGKSCLIFDGQRFDASTIAHTWSLTGQPIVTLAACETAIELSAPEGLDEYCGVDLACRMAGAQAVYSTMWPVADALAAVGSLFFPSWQMKHRVTPGEALVRFQLGLRSSRWKGWLLRDEQIALEPPPAREALHALSRTFSSLTPDAFSHPSAWSAFRCFGPELRGEHQ